MTLQLPPMIVAAMNWSDVTGDRTVAAVVIVGLTAAVFVSLPVFVSKNPAMWWKSANDAAHGYVVPRALLSLVAFI